VIWLKNTKRSGMRVNEVDDPKSPTGKDKRVFGSTGNATRWWARFYEIDTGRPFFCDRDGVKKYSLAEIGYERRNGYAWYGTWGEELIKNDYEIWMKRIDSKN